MPPPLSFKAIPDMAVRRVIVFVLLLWVVSMAAHAAPILDAGDDEIRLTDFPVGYLIDNSQSLTYQEVREKTYNTMNSKGALGTGASVTWHRIALKNPGLEKKVLFLHLPAAFQVRAIEIYEERSQSLVEHAEIEMK